VQRCHWQRHGPLTAQGKTGALALAAGGPRLCPS
jgi:hypothetical protein